ncbi:MAG: carboxy terminal-processing peptidase [Succinivibrionaceae bacterium]|nr:carboxy terminal-processing peptidase [Succinivibrionaceae bacterium]
MLRELARPAALCALLCLATPALGKVVVPTLEELPRLAQETQHQTACSRISNYFTRAHYKLVRIDRRFVDQVIDRLLYFLDYNRSLITSGEVDEIYKNRDRIAESLTQCDLAYPYELYNNNLRRRFAKYSYFIEAVKRGVDVSGHERLIIDRHRNASFPSTESELHALWDTELKNEFEVQLLSKKTEEEARKRIIRRYEIALSKLEQSNSEDAFSTFENAFAAAIDPHTNYLSPVDSENFNDDINLSLEGIGAVLSSEEEYTVINSIIPGSPAEATKRLRPKDRIVGVRQENGTYDDILGWRLSDVVRKIKGPKGTVVTLDIERIDGGNTKTFSVRIVRDKIKLQEREAKGKIHEINGSKVGVLTIKSFYNNLHQDIERELRMLLGQGMEALVIDLRNNGGGLLPEAIDSTGLFIHSGPVVQVRDVAGNIVPEFDNNPQISYEGPLVVLVNRLSASSSEIMAAALRDWGRAVVVGDTTFGKGTVQQNRPLSRIYDFNDNKMGSIHYTIAKFYRVNGGSTQLKGVEPDIRFPSMVDSEEYGESSEVNALDWDSVPSASYRPYTGLEGLIPELKARHEARVKGSKEFSLLARDLERYQALKSRDSLTVNLAERRVMQKEDDDYSLSTTNERLRLMGLPPVKAVSDLKPDFEFTDTLLNEAIAVAHDLAALGAGKER